MINVFHIVSNKTWTGHEQYVSDLASCLRDDPDFYVEIVTKKTPSTIARFRRIEVPISILPLKGMTDFDSPVRFARLLKRGQNVIHVHSFHDAVSAMVAKRMCDNPQVRVVLTLHGVKRRKLNYMSKRVYREMDRIIFVSKRGYESTMQGLKLQEGKIMIMSDSVKPVAAAAMASVGDLRERFGISKEQTLFMYHGRLNKDRGLETLLRAAALLDRKTFFLVIVGEGQRKRVTRYKNFVMANNLVDNVAMPGYSEHVQELIRQCDVGVLPSIIPEAWSLRNMEYMMQGKALITTDNGAQSEYLQNGRNALLVPPDDHQLLADAMQRLITDRELRSQLGAQAQADYNEQLNYDKFYREITDVYRSLF